MYWPTLSRGWEPVNEPAAPLLEHGDGAEAIMTRATVPSASLPGDPFEVARNGQAAQPHRQDNGNRPSLPGDNARA